MGKKGLLQYACDQLVSPERVIFRECELGPFTQHINKIRIIRENFHLRNQEGFIIREKPINYVIYLHTRGGCRTEGLFLKHIMLPNFGLVLFDFAGSGFSSGNHITLGLKESKDLEMVIENLMQLKRVKKIILWGRSMGAITALNFAKDINNQNIISTLIVDSPFSNFNQMIQDFVFAKFKIPRCLTQFFLKRVLVKTQKKTGVDLQQINPEQWACNINVPCFFTVTKKDDIARPSEVKKIYQNIKCKEKEFHLFPGNHASNRQINQTIQALNFILKYNNQFQNLKDIQKIECLLYIIKYLFNCNDRL